LEARFERLLKELFTALNFTVQVEPKIQGVRPDLYVTNSAAVTAIVEAKLYRTQTIGPSTIKRAADQAELIRQNVGADRCILAISSRVDRLTMAELHRIPNLVVYDYDVLCGLLREYPQLSADFNSLMDEAFAFRSEARLTPIFVEDLDYLKSLKASEGQTSPLSAEDLQKGKALYETLTNIPVGAQGATAFEDCCQRCLEYAFKDDLLFLGRQKQSDSGLHRFDLIAKIKSNSDFWLSLPRDFRSRYIIFEFKNYKDAISQKEVYSTEKYLFPAAMRGTAIVISRNGANHNAEIVARGALRESGKIIILLSQQDIEKILDLKDKGDDPSQVIFNVIDEMLTSIER
jgi:hypothetical protein